MRSYQALEREIAELIAEPDDDQDGDEDRSVYDWFGPDCDCPVERGQCRKHHRARPEQTPPADFGTWMVLAGRGFGKTRTGVEWVRKMAYENPGSRGALVAATAADVRDTIVEGVSGILATSPQWFMPTYEPSKRKLTWPNGSRASTYSAEEPNRLRGPQHHWALSDELAAWSDPRTYDMLLMGLRLGERPQHCITTTPKATPLIKKLVENPAVIKTGGSTFDNQRHLAESFFTDVVETYRNTRLGRQELFAELLELVEAVWFTSFDRAKHIQDRAEYVPGTPVHLAIDAGTSKVTGAVWFQCHQVDKNRRCVTVFADACITGCYSLEAAERIQQRSIELPCNGIVDTVRIDPASGQQTSIGMAAYNAYLSVFGERVTAKWPQHRVVDGLDFLELMLDRELLFLHPRCTNLIDSFVNYRRKEVAGIVVNYPHDPQPPHEDMMDALRGGIRAQFPEGVKPEFKPAMRMHHRDVF